MSAYLVRLIEGKEIVGVFSCESLNQLAALVDECTGTHHCEYRTLPNGGIIWPQGEAVSIPYCHDHEADTTQCGELFSEGEPTLTEAWAVTLADSGRQKTWRRVPDHQSPMMRAFATG